MRAILLAAVVVLLAAAPAADRATIAATAPSSSELVAYGKAIVTQTRRVVPRYAGAGLSCQNCHLNAGTKPDGGAFTGIAATYPQWNARAHRFIALQDRIAECFLYSMNGTPPPYTSREMIAVVAYITSLSKGQPIGTAPRDDTYPPLPATGPANVSHGAQLYATRCAACHASGGNGIGAFPPLWGPRSFNDGAGMHKLPVMAAFVRGNMPFGAPPNTLSPQEALDVSAFVLTKPRPHFDRARPIAFPPLPAGTF